MADSSAKWTLDPLGVAIGKYAGGSAFREFGYNDDIDTTTAPEDIWSGGGLWVPPTQARVHDLVSTDAADTSTVAVYGLTSWQGTEEFELVTLNGTTPVSTTNSWVVIHRMVIASGAINVGAITATAQTDATVTARIEVGFGQTGMCVYGLGALQNLLLTRFSGGMNRGGGGANGYAEFALLQNSQPETDLDAFVTAGYRTAASSGSSVLEIPTGEGILIAGPALLKIQVDAVGANDTRVFASFGGFRFDV